MHWPSLAGTLQAKCDCAQYLGANTMLRLLSRLGHVPPSVAREIIHLLRVKRRAWQLHDELELRGHDLFAEDRREVACEVDDPFDFGAENGLDGV